jgi:hypothetical protein
MTKTLATPLRGPAAHAHRIRAAQIALFAACKRATELGYTPLLPAAEAQAPYDLVLVKPGGRQAPLRVQSKHRANGQLPAKSPVSGRRASKREFDHYALYLPSIDRTVFVPVALAGATIATSIPNAATPFYWWEDFDRGPCETLPRKRTTVELGGTLSRPTRRGSRAAQERGRWPEDAVLLAALEEEPMSAIARRIGVSETAVRKRVARLGGQGHPPGYWASRRAASRR